jgi:signal transduction histidine kinase
MNREHDTIEEGHPACQGEEFLELPLLSSRHLAALKTAAFRQGVTVGRLLRRLIRDYLAVLRERGLESETRRPHALAEWFDGKFLRNRTGVGPRDGLILASEVFSELPRSGTGTNGLERSPRMLPANEEAERSSRPTGVARDRPETANNHPRADQALALLAHELRNPLGAIRTALRMLHQVRDDPATLPRFAWWRRTSGTQSGRKALAAQERSSRDRVTLLCPYMGYPSRRLSHRIFQGWLPR